MCVTNGFARFAYGLLLPAMRTEMGWSYAQAGWLNTANALGYLAGAVLTLSIISRIRPSQLFAFGMVTTALSLLATGLYEPLWWQTLWRVLAGLFGAMSFATSSALAAQLFRTEPRKSALAIALLFGFGGGLGIALAGLALPPMIEILGTESWPMAWIGIGVTSLAFLPLGLWSAWQLRPPRAKIPPRPRIRFGPMKAEVAGYGAFGLGYIVYFTFLSAWMTEQGAGVGTIALTWVMLGLCLCVSPFLWRPVFAYFRGGAPLAMVLTGIATGSALPVLWPTVTGLVLSAAIFGLSVFMSPGAVTSFVRHNLEPEDWGSAMSAYTVVFAVAQTIAPWAAGAIGDLTGGIGASLLVASGVLLAGAAGALTQRPLRTGA